MTPTDTDRFLAAVRASAEAGLSLCNYDTLRLLRLIEEQGREILRLRPIASPPSLAHPEQAEKGSGNGAPDFLPGDRVRYWPGGLTRESYLGTVRTAPWQLGGGQWVVHLHEMETTYRRGECSVVYAAACDALDLVERPIASPPSSPPPPAAPAGAAPASLSCTPPGSEGGHGLVRTCPDCAWKTTRADACLTCGGTSFVGVP